MEIPENNFFFAGKLLLPIPIEFYTVSIKKIMAQGIKQTERMVLTPQGIILQGHPRKQRMQFPEIFQRMLI